MNVCRRLIEKNELCISKFKSIFTGEFFDQGINLVFMIFTDVEGTHAFDNLDTIHLLSRR